MERIVRAFNREHQDVQIRMQIIPWGTYYDKITLGLAYGGAPDVFILHVNRFPEYARYGSLDSVDDLIGAGRLRPDDFVPTAWDACRWNGKAYAVPLDCHPIGLYYNKRLFREAGIVDANGRAMPPRNLDDFLRAARKLTIDRNGDGKPEQWAFAYTWLRTNAYTFYNQFGTAILSEDLKEAAIASPEAVQAMELMKSLIYDHRVCPPPEGQDAWMGFQTGRVAMALEGIYMLSSLEEQDDLDFAGAPAPQFGPKMAVWGGSHLLVMPRSIAPQRRKAVWEFMCYLSDHSLEWARGGQVPVRKDILSSREFEGLEVQHEFSKELPYVVYEPPSVSYNQIVPFADAAIEAVLGRIKSPEEALHEAAERIEVVLERE